MLNQSTRRLIRSIQLLLASTLVPAGPPPLAAPPPAANEFLDLSLEELLKLEITSVAKRPQQVSKAAAAVFVITADDIRRSGVTSIPEALRLAPGLHVARIDGNKWSIGARGANGRFATKLLVLIDGRSVYTPLFAGVFWDVQDTLLEDIDRIEVIRGPGASLWGSNAVNGVINIITKRADATQGGIVSAGAGNQEKGFTGMRWGGEVGEIGHYRVYGKYLNRDENRKNLTGSSAADRTEAFRAGFRTDLQPSKADELTIQGDFYNGRSGSSIFNASLRPPYLTTIDETQQVQGFNLLSRWRHELDSGDHLTMQAYVDRTEREWFYIVEERNTADLEVQYRTRRFDGHDVLAGLGYRLSAYDTRVGGIFGALSPTGENNQLFSGFLQDDITLLADTLTLTLGSKLEHNDFTHFEVQPNARLLWTPSENHSFWASIARAVRIPTPGDSNSHFIRAIIPPGSALNQSPFPVALRFNGTRQYDSESVIAYELGYKLQFSQTLSFDFAAFYNDNTRQRGAGLTSLGCLPTGTFPACLQSRQQPTALVQNVTINNNVEGDVLGFEAASDWRPLDNWRLQTSYSLSRQRFHDPVRQRASDYMNRMYPNQALSLRSSWNPLPTVDVDAWFRYVDRLVLITDVGTTRIPSYAQIDLRLAWRPVQKLELSIVGQNLLDDGQPEFSSELGDLPLVDIRRSVFGQVRWEF